MRGEVTNRVLLGRKSPGCPAGVFRSGRDDLGGKQTWRPEHNEISATSKLFPARSRFKRDNCGKPTHFSIGEGRWHRGRNRREHTVYRRGRGSSIQEQTVGDNVGKLPWAAGTGYNLQGLSKQGQKPKEERAQRERRMSPYERRRRSNVLPGDGSRLPNGGNTRVGQRGSGHLAAFSVCLGGRLDKTGTHATDRSRGEAVGKPGVAGVYTNQRLNLSKPWEGLRRTGQGLEPDPGNLAVRDFRGASRNVRHGETVNPPAIERAGPETPHLQRGALDLYPNHWERPLRPPAGGRRSRRICAIDACDASVSWLTYGPADARYDVTGAAAGFTAIRSTM